MMLPLVLLLAAPLCSIPTAIVVWLLHRNEPTEDGKLVRDYVVFLCLFAVSLWQVTRLHSVRMRFDSDYRIQTQLDANPIYHAMDGIESEAQTFRAKLAQLMYEGNNEQQAMRLMRPWLRNEATSYSGFADQKTRLQWASRYVSTLKELQSNDPMTCYKEIAQQDLDPSTLEQIYSAENTAAFQQAAAEVFKSAVRGMKHDYPADDYPADFNAAARESAIINNDLDTQFDSEVADIIRRHRFSATNAVNPEKICAARIFQLESMLQRPQAMAALLVDSALRYK